MSRWTIERSGTGVERSGTGVEKSGTGVERSGTGIERSGTGIEKSGTGVERTGTGCRRVFMACLIAMITLASNVQAGNLNPAGSLQLVVEHDTVAVSWILDGSVFSGVSSMSGSYAILLLTEVAIIPATGDLSITHDGTRSSLNITGGGTGNKLQVTGGGTGNSLQVTGGGTGSALQVTGGGTGAAAQVTGGGTGNTAQVTGGGTGNSLMVTGGGTGNRAQVTGGGTGHSILIAGNGTEAIQVTLPQGTGLAMEVSLGCGSGSVTILDSSFSPLATFDNVPIVGDAGFCASGFGDSFAINLGGSFPAQ